ncbi:unnamed protein product [Agarophyton chilense]
METQEPKGNSGEGFKKMLHLFDKLTYITLEDSIESNSDAGNAFDLLQEKDEGALVYHKAGGMVHSSHRNAIPRQRMKLKKTVDFGTAEIRRMERSHKKDKLTRRSGFCVDTGAPSSDIGLKELRRLATQYEKSLLRLKKSVKQFRFADVSFASLGCVEIPLAAPSGRPPIWVAFDVVAVDLPALLGLEILDPHALLPDNFSNSLRKRILLEENHTEHEADRS